jgi:hypothetical protein
MHICVCNLYYFIETGINSFYTLSKSHISLRKKILFCESHKSMVVILLSKNYYFGLTVLQNKMAKINL